MADSTDHLLDVHSDEGSHLLEISVDTDFIRAEIQSIEEDRERDNVRFFPGVTGDDLDKEQKPKSMLRNLRDVLITSDTRAVEFISALVAICWGVWVANPWFSVYESAPDIYAGPAEVAPEWIWGTFTLVVGLAQLLALARANRDMRKHAAFVAFFMWLLAAFAAFNGPSALTTAPVTYPVLTFMAAWAYARQAGC